MSFSPLPWDLAAILVLLAVLVPWRGAVRVRELLAAPELTSRERIGIYASTIAFQWLLSGVTFWRCLARGWTPQGLGVALQHRATTIGCGIGLALLLGLLQVAAFRQLGRVPPERRGRLAEITNKLMPRTLAEVLAFLALVCTVGFCEEFLYRGFVFAAFESMLPNSIAAAVIGSSLLFGIGHVYQGRRGVVNTSVLGAIFAGFRVWTGSLVPAIAGHVAVDLVAGLGAMRWMSSPGQTPTPPAAGEK